MKKISYLFILVLALVLTSCSSDDDSAPEILNQILYTDSIVDITEAEVRDYGGIDYYSYDFNLIGTLGSEEYYVYVELLSPITPDNLGFTPGTFNYSATTPNTPRSHFGDAGLDVGLDSFTATGGTVVVSGNGEDNIWTITVDLTLNNGESLTASYSGTFDYFDSRI